MKESPQVEREKHPPYLGLRRQQVVLEYVLLTGQVSRLDPQAFKLAKILARLSEDLSYTPRQLRRIVHHSLEFVKRKYRTRLEARRAWDHTLRQAAQALVSSS